MKILDKLLKRQQAKQKSALERYAALVKLVSDAGDDAPDSALEQLSDAGAAVGFDAAAIQQDIDATKQLAELSPVANELSQRQSVASAVGTKVRSRKLAIEEESKKLLLEIVSLDLERGRAQEHARQSSIAGQAIATLKTSRPWLFGGEIPVEKTSRESFSEMNAAGVAPTYIGQK
jgi:hypothetical protein